MMKPEIDTKKIMWLDAAKFVAIFGVLLEHTHGTLYESRNLEYASVYMMPLFVLLSGITSWLSGKKHDNDSWFRCFLKRIKSITIAYCIATAIYLVGKTGMFVFTDYVDMLIHFNATIPMYYVALYLMLMMVFPLLYRLLASIPKKPSGYLGEAIIGALILVVSILMTYGTNILDIYGGGGKLFGGTFLFLYYIGMLIGKHLRLSAEPCGKMALCTLIFGVLWVVWWRFICVDKMQLDQRILPGEWLNPPGISEMVFGLLTLFFCYGLFSLLPKWKAGRKLAEAIGWVGSHSLYIFLYHMIFLNVLGRFVPEAVPIVLKWILYFAVMIFGGILVELVLKTIKKTFLRQTDV